MALQDIVTKGATDRSVTVRIIDSTDGTPETGVVFNTSGIDLWYRREGAAKTSITEATLSALTDAHSDGGFLHVADGVYRLDLPDAAFASGANSVDYGGTVTGMVVIGGRVRLTDLNVEVATIVAASLAAQAKADVNAEVVDALATDTYAEPAQGAPAATSSIATKLGFLFAWTRNKKDNNGSETKFYADDGTTVNQKQATSESGGTVTKGEIATGP